MGSGPNEGGNRRNLFVLLTGDSGDIFDTSIGPDDSNSSDCIDNMCRQYERGVQGPCTGHSPSQRT